MDVIIGSTLWAAAGRSEKGQSHIGCDGTPVLPGAAEEFSEDKIKVHLFEGL